MNIQFLSFTKPDQQRALEFYTNALGFVKHADIDIGGGQRWLTVTAAGRPQMEFSLAPQTFELGRIYQPALLEAGISVAALTTDDIAAVFEEHLRQPHQPRATAGETTDRLSRASA